MHNKSWYLLSNETYFIETKFAQSLCRITDKSWSPSFWQSFNTFFSQCKTETIEYWSILQSKIIKLITYAFLFVNWLFLFSLYKLVFCSIDLQTTFNQIQWNDHCMCRTARDNTTQTAKGKIFQRSKFAWIWKIQMFKIIYIDRINVVWIVYLLRL